MTLLDVRHLTTCFDTHDGLVRAVNDISFTLEQGRCLGVVGESGCGKSQLFLSIMGLLAKNGRTEGRVLFQGSSLLDMPAAHLNQIRGVRMAMIFQDPMTCLNPYLRVSRQMTEVLVAHEGISETEAACRALDMLQLVGLPEAQKRFHSYPHVFSGGMRQRVMIAMALLCRPALLIADEPTTALDVTVQAQILDLIRRLSGEFNMATVLITHDLGVIAGLCDRVMVMYAGRIVEEAGARNLFNSPQHPYTRGLVDAVPRADTGESRRLMTISGHPPDMQDLPPGCAFHERCAHAMDICREIPPDLRSLAPDRKKACHLEKLP